ncbi:unnamed protein product [Durusdinium trenchii]|uniref:Uncharacterized protein n=2 Tax=Durusdinium trenchii TaxID=1381693 RepID=A0ABP0L3L1_9DINO
MFRRLPLEHAPYARRWERFQALEKWLDLAIRPDGSGWPEEADLLQHETDDVPALKALLDQVQNELWSTLPMDFDDDHLEARDSRLGVEAGLGLFATRDWPNNRLVAHYGGNIHTLKSSMKLQDQEYVMRLGSSAAGDEIAGSALYVDAGPHLAVKGRYINDCSSSVWPLGLLQRLCPLNTQTRRVGVELTRH